ncbi:hypothetical protein ACQUFE_17580, partial [Enterococcus casseliflavus]|uniref:hypothetical protein n=1 Tax=Enterococcus casseliflavus TaxID=37734 RepID=UPI003D098C86
GGRVFNLGDVSNVDNVINTFYDDEEIDPNAYAAASKSGRPFGWTDGRKLKKVKVKGVSGSTAAEARAAQEEFEAKEAKRRNDAARKQFEDDKHECVREWLGLNVKEK